MKKQIQQGFTLIELMIVVAIIGILASIALPAYQTYVAKTDITSTMASAAAGKTAIWTQYVDNGRMPDAGTGAGQIEEAGSATIGLYNTMQGLRYQSAVAYTKVSDTEANFVVTLDNVNGNVNGSNMTYTYEDIDGELKFECEADPAIDNKYLPKECHN